MPKKNNYKLNQPIIVFIDWLRDLQKKTIEYWQDLISSQYRLVNLLPAPYLTKLFKQLAIDPGQPVHVPAINNLLPATFHSFTRTCSV